VQTKVERSRGQGPYLTHTLSDNGALASAGNATSNPSRQTIALIIDAKEVHGHEYTCELVSITPTKSRDKMSFKCLGEGLEWSEDEQWILRDRAIDIWGWTITQPTLVTRRLHYETVYKKCPLSAVTR
jgi:hypothetical protein